MNRADVETLVKYAREIRSREDLLKLYKDKTPIDERWPDILLCYRDWQTVKNLIAEYGELQKNVANLHEVNLGYQEKVKKCEECRRSFVIETESLKHRIEGLRSAVRKWRIKAGVDAPGEKPVLIMCEEKRIKKKGNEEWQIYEHWVLPVEKNPHLLREAWEWLDKREKRKYAERIYFHGKHGWVAVLRTKSR